MYARRQQTFRVKHLNLDILSKMTNSDAHFFGKISVQGILTSMKTKTKKQTVGSIGEDIAVRFLVKHGFTVIERNYLKKFGEIDIICRKDGKIHFVEVKTVSQEIVSHETCDEYRPEDNVHEAKLKRIGRTIEVYLNEKDMECEWEFHVISVTLSDVHKVANVRFLRNLII